MPATYRAAYWTSEDRQGEVVLTSPEQARLSDSDLLSAARDEARRAGLDLSTGEIAIGDWTDRHLASCSVEGCARPVYAHGLCEAHDRRRRRGSTSSAPVRERGTEPLLSLSLRLPASVHAALGDEPGSMAREILVRWAKRKR